MKILGPDLCGGGVTKFKELYHITQGSFPWNWGDHIRIDLYESVQRFHRMRIGIIGLHQSYIGLAFVEFQDSSRRAASICDGSRQFTSLPKVGSSRSS